MEYVFGAVIFLFGSALGSFIGVIVDRYNTGLSFFKGRSFCFSCNTVLGKKDLFPIFSFIFFKGKCGYCGSKIPAGAIVTEFLMGVLALLALLRSELSLDNISVYHFLYFLVLLGIFGSILLITVYDIKHFIIPDSFLGSLLIFSFLYILISDLSIFRSLLSGLILVLPFLLIFLISDGRWLGFGDVKYIAVIGFLLGLNRGVSAVVLSFWIGAAFSVLLLLLQKLKLGIDLPLFRNNLTIKSEIPFGPFLSLGLIIGFCVKMDLFHIDDLLKIF